MSAITSDQSKIMDENLLNTQIDTSSFTGLDLIRLVYNNPNRKLDIGVVYTQDDCFSKDKPLETSEDIPFGISIISSILKKQGHHVRLFVLTNDTYEEHLSEYINNEKPKLFCLTSVSSQYWLVHKIAKEIKNLDPSIFTILGGHHASLAPDNAISSPYLDAICMGEGDHAIKMLSNLISEGEEVKGIPNLWIKRKDGSVEKNLRLPFEEDLDKLPFVDHELWADWVAYPDQYVSVLVGRGCPFQCTYCSNHAMAKLSTGKYVRYRSPQNMIAEIQSVCDRFPNLRNIYLEVETIGANIYIANDLFEQLAEWNDKRTEPIKFGMNIAFNKAWLIESKKETLKQFFEYCNKANVATLNVGIESGSAKIRKGMKRPPHSNEELVQFLEMCKSNNIDINIYLLIGLPHETPADFKESVEIVRRVNPKSVYLSIFYPYIGTDMYDVANETGTIEDTGKYIYERMTPIYTSPLYPKWKIRRDYVLFWFNVYKGIWPWYRIIAWTIKSYISAYPWLRKPYKWIISKSIFLNNIKSKMQGFTSGTPFETEQHFQNNYGGGSGEATTGFVAKINN